VSTAPRYKTLVPCVVGAPGARLDATGLADVVWRGVQTGVLTGVSIRCLYKEHNARSRCLSAEQEERLLEALPA